LFVKGTVAEHVSNFANVDTFLLARPGINHFHLCVKVDIFPLDKARLFVAKLTYRTQAS